MKAKIVLRKKGNALVAECVGSIDALAKLKEGGEVIVRLHQARNPKHTRLWWVLLKKVCDSGAFPADPEALAEWCCYKLGHVRTVRFSDGTTQISPKSLSEESMSQTDFKEFFDRAIFYICREFLSGADWVELKAEIEEACRDRRLEAQERAYRRS